MQTPDTADIWLKDMPRQFQDRHNIGVLVRAFARQIQEIQKVFKDMNTMLDLDAAVGKNLDYVGTIIPLSRKEAGELAGMCLPEPGPILSDERYVQILKYRLLKNTSDCTYYDIMEGLEYLYDFPFLYREDIQHPATIILGMPLDLDQPDFTFHRRLCLKPGGVRIFGEKKFFLFILICIGYENRLTMVSSFYPRCNMPELFLDGKEYLDGGYLLNGYQNMQDMETFCLDGEGRLDGRYGLDGLQEIQILDYYPVSLLIRGDFQQNVIVSEWLHCLFEALFSLYAVPAMRTGSCFYPRYNVPLFRLDGTQQLDGAHFLNETDQDFEQFFLEGKIGLDGGYILNGYMDSDNFDFYPVELQMLGDFRQQVHMVTGQICLSPEVLFLAGVEPAIQIRNRFYPRKNMPLLLLNGEADLGGEYLLNRRLDECSMFYLDGERSLDGRHFLNGYTGSDDEFYPAEMQISGDFQPGTGLSGQLRSVASVQLLPVSGTSDILMSGSFYPRYSPPSLYLNGGEELDGDRTLNGYMESDNIPPCSLNGEAGLDGEYALNGYKNNQSLGFYPLNVLVNGCFTQNIMPSGEARLLSDALLSVQSDGSFGVRENAGVKAGTGNVVQMCTWAGEQVSAGRGKLTVEKDLWYLEGRQQLDGQVRLDADSYEIQL